jgi:hypothetical protein
VGHFGTFAHYGDEHAKSYKLLKIIIIIGRRGELYLGGRKAKRGGE